MKQRLTAKAVSYTHLAAFTIFNLFHSEKLEAERLERAILSIVWVNLCPEILADNTAPFILIV